MEPVHHRAKRQIGAHAHLCVLSDLLMRIAENRTGESWPLFRERLERVSVGRIETEHASIVCVKRLTASEREAWLSCGIEATPKTLQLNTQSPLLLIGCPERASYTPDPPDRCLLPFYNTRRHPCEWQLSNAPPAAVPGLGPLVKAVPQGPFRAPPTVGQPVVPTCPSQPSLHRP